MVADSIEQPDPGAACFHDDRAAQLVEAMTTVEKLRLVFGHFPPLMQGEGPPDMPMASGYVAGIPRLGIPALCETDAGLGVANIMNMRPGDEATALPGALAIASSWDVGLARQAGAMIGAEARQKGYNLMLAGGGNLTRDPWSGRAFEYFGEDPLLTGLMGGASVAGVQSNGIIATVKHFALNAQETGRRVLDARIDIAALRESDLLAFEIAIAEGQPGAVMAAYNRLNGIFASENAFLLTEVLRKEWQFRGFVMSDWGGVHSTHCAVAAGLDQQSGCELDRRPFFGDDLAAALEDGSIAERAIDRMVHRIIRVMAERGLLDPPKPAQFIDVSAHLEVARRVAEQGIVLLKNRDDTLPLRRDMASIAVIGEYADLGVLSGGGSSQVRSRGGAPVELPLEGGAAASFARITYHASPPLRAIAEIAPNADIHFNNGLDRAAAARLAAECDVSIIFATQWRTEAVDLPGLSLDGDQDALIKTVAQRARRTVVVLQTGGAVLMPWLADVDAVIEAWYPGQCGGEAIARIVFGVAEPCGRLPLSFPAHLEQFPRAEAPGLAQLTTLGTAEDDIHGLAPRGQPFAIEYHEGANVGYRWFHTNAERPLFPFGFGLGYTRYKYGNCALDSDGISVRCDIGNIGDRAGVAIPQLYATVRDCGGRQSRRLVGWERVELDPGQSRRSVIRADRRLLRSFDAAAGSWRRSDGACTLSLGDSAEHLFSHFEIPDIGALLSRNP